MQSPGVAEPSYQAPFSRGVPLGAVGHERPRLGFADQQTLRYRGDATGLSVSINGLRGETRVTAPGAFVFDAPFMTAPLFVVAFAPEMLAVTPRAVIGTPRFAKIPKSDAIVQFPGMADLWYDRGNYIVHEARFLRLNVDARTVRTATDGDAKPKLDSSGVTFASEDGTMLAGVVSRPPGVTKKLPAIVFVPPGAGVGRNFGGEGPDPIYPDLVFAMRGYVVIRYDARGVSKSGGSREIET